MKLQSKTSYRINTTSDLLFELFKNKIFSINSKDMVCVGHRDFLGGASIVVSDKFIKSCYCITRGEVPDGVPVINLIEKKDIIDNYCKLILGETSIIKTLNKKLRYKPSDTLIYYINSFYHTRDESVFDINYKGISSIKNRYKAFFDFLHNMTPDNLHNLPNYFIHFEQFKNTFCSILNYNEQPEYLRKIIDELYTQNTTHGIFSLINKLSKHSSQTDFNISILSDCI